jgi:uncharacterized lipoprotein YddW (UPF0748 family)
MSSHAASTSNTAAPPADPREFRAAWVATVANIDWPSKPGLPAAEQQREALAILDRAASLRLNALVLQVRPAGDALFPSPLEPWSEYLTGEQGKPPEPFYDPLAFWLKEAHARALELHVWLNPYRARHPSAKTPLVAPHLGIRAPQAVKRYGDLLWMDPGEPAAAQQTLAVVADLLARYAVDGVHIDDYFYPYPLQVPAGPDTPPPTPGAPPPPPRPDVPFPDDEAFGRYRAAGGLLERDDWRRANVDALVAAMYDTIRRVRPGTRFGVSPFGIGRPDKRPSGIAGFSQYDRLFADVERWFAQGWLDYLAPQLYWPIDRTAQAFPVLLDYWLRENSAGRHVWPGLYTSLLRREPAQELGPRAWPGRELLAQIGLVRDRGERRDGRDRAKAAGAMNGGTADEPGGTASGHIHFSMVALMQDREAVATQLGAGLYADAALVPATPWLDDRAPPTPQLRGTTDGRLRFAPAAAPAAGVATERWALWRRIGGQWRFAVLPGAARDAALEGADAATLAAVSRTGIASARVAWNAAR